MNHEPIRHHYIPQFILKNFCIDGKGNVLYCEKASGATSKRNTRDLFMGMNLYRDEANNPDNPVIIENNLSKLERGASKAIKRILVAEKECLLTNEETELIKLFFAVMSFRSMRTSHFFKENDMSSDIIYQHFAQGDSGDDFWKKNLEELATCKSISEVLESPNIDAPIKLFMRRDTCAITGTYLIIINAKGSEEFIIGDAYPDQVVGCTDNGIELPLYAICPISPTRAILIAANEIDAVSKSIVPFGRIILSKPKEVANGGILRYKVRTVDDYHVRLINEMLKKDSAEGFIYT